MKWILVVFFSLSMLGCSNTPGYYRSPPDTCDGAPGCAASAIFDGVIHTKPAPKKCSEMSGTQKEKCDAQVEALKNSIKKAQGR